VIINIPSGRHLEHDPCRPQYMEKIGISAGDACTGGDKTDGLRDPAYMSDGEGMKPGTRVSS